MEKYIKKSRLIVLALVMALLLSVYGLTLYRIEALDVRALEDDTQDTVATTVTVSAARGSLLDRNGTLLVSDRTVRDVRISRDQLLKEADPNGTVLKLIRAAERWGVEYTDNFPVTKTAPFEFDAYATSSQRSQLSKYFAYFKNSLESYFEYTVSIDDPDNPGISATQLISWMREHYKIDYTVTAEDARKIIGVRYGLEIQVVAMTADYVFARDIPEELVSYISEQALPSVSISTRSTREYHTDYGAHLLGYVGAMTRAQYDDKYKDLGYPLNSQVGQTGAEAAFEEYLHGTPGSVTTYRDASGAVIDVVENSPALAGDNVYLTIDISLQAATENALATRIAAMNAERIAQAEAETAENERYQEPELAVGGAAVMLDINTGEVLALASYPTFDLSTFYENYSQLANDTANHPLNNRATSGQYNPGSTFKMVTAYAALSNLFISPETIIHDDSEFTEYADAGFAPRCYVYPYSHGDLNVVGALAQSCNFFFYTIGDRIGINRLSAAARLFGFGDHTGIEIGDNVGWVASRELKMELKNEGWWAADTILASIGQGYNEFTPVQLANYVSTIANGGTLNKVTVLRNIVSFDYSDLILKNTPQVKSVIEDTGGYIPVLQRGMRAVATEGTAKSALSNYQVPVAAKTGTVQSANSSMNDGVFVCYAPADDPEIAIAVVVEKGGSGSSLITIARDMMDAYFSGSASRASQSVSTDETLLK